MIVVVMGVSGSGKTAVGMALALRLGWAFEDADDRHPVANVERMRQGTPLTDEDRRMWLRGLRDAIHAWSDQGRDVVLACSALRQWHRDALRSGAPDGGSLHFVYLHGTHDLIDQRLRHRVGHFMPPSLLESQLATLEEPDASEALVIDIAPPIAAIVDAIVTGLRLAARPGVKA